MSLHLALQAGISIPESVEMLAEEETDAAARVHIGAVADALKDGASFADALRKSAAFPEYLTDMAEVGETTGNLDDTLLSLSRYYERQDGIAKSVRSSVTYPVMLLAVLLFVLVLFVVKILPIFDDVYRQLNVQMSGIAVVALHFGEWLAANWVLLLVVIAVLGVLAGVFRRKLSATVSKLFLSGSLGAALVTARFANILALTLSAGMEMSEALTMTSKISGDKAITAKIDAAAEQAVQGASFSQCIQETGIFSSLYNKMIAIGVRTGSTVSVIEDIARRSNGDANDKIEAYIGKIEPTLVIIMSVLVGLLLLSVMLPLANVMSLL
jgi:type IV pilus assembly protein PilC